MVKIDPNKLAEAHDFCSGGLSFECRSGHRIPQLRFFVVFLYPSRNPLGEPRQLRFNLLSTTHPTVGLFEAIQSELRAVLCTADH